MLIRPLRPSARPATSPAPRGHRAPGVLVRATLPFLLASLGACVDVDLRTGRDALGQGRYTEAIDAFGRARDRGLPNTDWQSSLAGAHRAEAMRLLETQDCDGATPHFDQAAALSTPLLRDAEGLYRCRVNKGDLPAGHLPTLEHLFELGDRRVVLLRDLFEGYASAGRTDDQLRMATELEQRFHLTLDDRRRLLPLLIEKGDAAAARRHMEILVIDDPKDPLKRLKLAELREADNDLPGARDILQRLTGELPDNPVVFLRLADFLDRRGETERAGGARARANTLRGIVPKADDRVMRPLPKSRR